MYRRGTDWFAVSVGVGILLFIFALIGGCVAYPLAVRSSDRYEVIAVEEKERGTEKSPYLIYTADSVYSVEDSLWFGDFRASDRYNQLDVGKTYRCNVAGWRFGLLSWYPNIIGPCSEVK